MSVDSMAEAKCGQAISCLNLAISNLSSVVGDRNYLEEFKVEFQITLSEVLVDLVKLRARLKGEVS